MKKMAIVAAAVIAAVALATPAQATQQASSSDVAYMTSLLKETWFEMSYSDQDEICGYFYVTPVLTRNTMASTFHNPKDGVFAEYSLLDVRRAMWRLLNWAC